MKKSLLINKVKKILLREARLNKFKRLVDEGKLTNEDIATHIFNGRSFIKPFDNSAFRWVLFNTISKGENHTIEDVKGSFDSINTHILTPLARSADGKIPVQEVPGGETVDLNPLILNKSTVSFTYDDAQDYIRVKESIGGSGSKSKKFQAILDAGFSGSKQDFEAVYEDENIIVVYPKTYMGSIATARMGPDKKYYTPPDVIGEMKWCTSVDSQNNMFMNYHRRLNLHMYYVTKKADYDKSDTMRKACVSFVKKYGQVSLYDNGGATVNASNKSIKEKDVASAYGQKLVDILTDDASKPNRLEINEEEYYKSITLTQYQQLKSAAISGAAGGELNITLFLREASQILTHTQRKDVYFEILDYDEALFASDSRGSEYRAIVRNAITFMDRKEFMDDKGRMRIINTVINEYKIKGGSKDYFQEPLLQLHFSSRKYKDMISLLVENSENEVLRQIFNLFKEPYSSPEALAELLVSTGYFDQLLPTAETSRPDYNEFSMEMLDSSRNKESDIPLVFLEKGPKFFKETLEEIGNRINERYRHIIFSNFASLLNIYSVFYDNNLDTTILIFKDIFTRVRSIKGHSAFQHFFRTVVAKDTNDYNVSVENIHPALSLDRVFDLLIVFLNGIPKNTELEKTFEYEDLVKKFIIDAGKIISRNNAAEECAMILLERGYIMDATYIIMKVDPKNMMSGEFRDVLVSAVAARNLKPELKFNFYSILSREIGLGFDSMVDFFQDQEVRETESFQRVSNLSSFAAALESHLNNILGEAWKARFL